MEDNQHQPPVEVPCEGKKKKKKTALKAQRVKMLLKLVQKRNMAIDSLKNRIKEERKQHRKEMKTQMGISSSLKSAADKLWEENEALKTEINGLYSFGTIRNLCGTILQRGRAPNVDENNKKLEDNNKNETDNDNTKPKAANTTEDEVVFLCQVTHEPVTNPKNFTYMFN